MMRSHLLRNAIVLSVLMHVLLLGGSYLLGDRVKPEAQTVSIDFISPSDLERMKKAEDLVANKQIVEQDAKSANEVTPENARFLSAKDQSVKKQTIAPNKGDFQNTKSKSALKAGAPLMKPVVHKNAANSKVERDTPVPMKDLFAKYDPAASMERQRKQQSVAAQAGQNGPEGAQGTAAASQTNDYAKDVDKGLETLLNTREFKYYSYYTRIRRQLAQHWEGKVREKLSKMYKEKRAPANVNEDRITKVIVVLNAAGTLVNVQIVSDSGLRDLDDAAVEAFRAAAPFPNPPKGIVEGDGTVKIRWDFVLES